MLPSRNLFHNKRIRLTALRSTDAPDIAAWYDDSESMRHFEIGPVRPRSQAAAEAWVAEMERDSSTITFGIRPLEEETLCGYLQLDGINHRDGHAGIGILIAAEQQDKGYGRQALELALDYAFSELSLHKVMLTIFSYNTRSIALAEKLGFRREGAFRQHVLRDGIRHDMYLYSLLRSEWKAARPN